MPFLYSRFAVAALLLAAPRLGLAQAVAPTQTAPAPRFYVGLAAFHSNFQLVAGPAAIHEYCRGCIWL